MKNTRKIIFTYFLMSIEMLIMLPFLLIGVICYFISHGFTAGLTRGKELMLYTDKKVQEL